MLIYYVNTITTFIILGLLGNPHRDAIEAYYESRQGYELFFASCGALFCVYVLALTVNYAGWCSYYRFLNWVTAGTIALAVFFNLWILAVVFLFSFLLHDPNPIELE